MSGLDNECPAGLCVAPGCGSSTPSRYHHLCDPCTKRVEAAMVVARPALMERMGTERAEAEAWLAAEWSPTRRWVIADDDYHEEPINDIVEHLVRETTRDGGSYLGFVDDDLYQRGVVWRRTYVPDEVPQPQTAWLVSDAKKTAEAWSTHLAPLLRAALEQALATFPLSHAGREIKDALTRRSDYNEEEQAEGAFGELWEGSGEMGLSDDAVDYLELRYYPSETWMCDVGGWPDSIGARPWQRYRVLPDEIMAILDAVATAEGSSG